MSSQEPKRRLTRREFCAAAVSAAVIAPVTPAQADKKPMQKPRLAGDWPTPRQNRCLNSVQPLAGKLRRAPKITAAIPIGKGQGMPLTFASKPDGPPDRILSLAYGALRCYEPNGKLLWESHPPGLNFAGLVAAEDLDTDGRVELALMAGRPTDPLGAVVLLAADTGKLLFRYDVEPMSYWWTLKVDHFLPDGVGKQLVMCEHAYPPDAKFGYIALFAFPKPGEKPQMRWRYDFDHYTCFPSILTADVNGDGVKEIAVETHSHMWIMDPRDGKVDQFIQWDVSPANVRSYGLVRFQDLNGDGLPEFFCIGNFAHHHEVLRNDHGKFALAWAHGWDNSVSTSKLATTWPDPPIADVDGDGKLEMLVNMYNSESEQRWMIRIYDAMTGEIKARVPGRIGVQLIDIDGDGAAEIVADISEDPTRTKTEGVCLLKVGHAGSQELWREDGGRAVALPEREGEAATQLRKAAYVEAGGKTQRLQWAADHRVLLADEKPPVTGPPPFDFSHIPATIGVAMIAPLAADMDGDGRNEVLHYHDGKVTIYRYRPGHGFETLESYPSDGEPALADLDGDGRPELIVGTASPTSDPTVQAIKPGTGGKTLWQVTLKHPNRVGMPYGRPLYFQTGRFTGKPTCDIYVYVGTPLVRSIMLDGRNGAILWEKGEIPGIERYFAPTVNKAAVWDFNSDGKDDLVFTCPDYYCVADGPTGNALLGPDFPPTIFHQPSQGLYTLPALLPNGGSEPTVCLVDGHYFRAGMTLHASPLWYQLPIIGEAHAGAEGFLQTPDGQWLMGFGRQDGQFACLDALTGKTRWEMPIQSSASDVCACDIDGDGAQEFVFGTSHGDVYALADRGGRPHIVWRARFPVGVSSVIIADVDGDGASEIMAALRDGTLCLLDTAEG
jgi:hypothetical protein